MMQMAPWKRISAETALAHPYLDLYHVAENEPVCEDTVQFDADAIERLPMNELHAQLELEAQYFQSRREIYPIEQV
jgi:hypothetical protein